MSPGDLMECEWSATRSALAAEGIAVDDMLVALGLLEPGRAPFERLTRLAPSRDLVLFAAEGIYGLSPARLDAFRLAHVAGGFHGAVLDRIIDRQGEVGEAGERLVAGLCARWVARLGEAIGDAALAVADVEEALSRLARGTVSERSITAPDTLSAADYAGLIADKTAWFSVAACALLRAVAPERLARFGCAAQLLMAAAQVVDDAQDEEEDRRALGVGFPAALGFPAGGLVRAAHRVHEAGCAAASDGGFHALATWLAVRAAAFAEQGAPGNPIQNELAGMIVAGAIVEPWAHALTGPNSEATPP